MTIQFVIKFQISSFSQDKRQDLFKARMSGYPKNIILKAIELNLSTLEKSLADRPEIIAAYLFGSAAKGDFAPRDLDILVLLRPDVDVNDIYFDLAGYLSDAIGIPEDRIDILFLNMDEAEPAVLYDALSTGILLKNSDPDMLGDSIDAVSRYFLENEAMMELAKRLRDDRLEDFCANR